MDDTAGLIVAFGTDLRNSGLLYGDEGNRSWLTISTTDNFLFNELSLLLGSGWSNPNARYLQWRASSGGSVIASGEHVFHDGETALFSRVGGFDTLELAAYTASGGSFGSYQAIAIDDVKATVFSAVPLPASAWFFMSALLGLVLRRRQHRQS
jgi:hypothetical protein